MTFERTPHSRSTLRPANASELATLYRQLSGTYPDVSTVLQIAVLVQPNTSIWARPKDADPIVAAADRLRAFGMRLVTLPGGADDSLAEGCVYLVGGTLHGWRTGAVIPKDLPALLDDVTELLTRERLRVWATLAARGAPPSFTRTHRPGSDSVGVVQFRHGDREIVAKIGDTRVIVPEVAFVTAANAVLTDSGERALFPETYAVHDEGGQSVSLMAAASPSGLERDLFTADDRVTLSPKALDLLEPCLERLAHWYRATVGTAAPTVCDYLYRGRYHALRSEPAFVSTFAAFFPGDDLAEFLSRPVLLPDGDHHGTRRVWSYDEATAWLDKTAARFLPARGSAVHGDIYVSNMLRGNDGDPILIDPRTIWEGRDRPDVGYGDPVFDLATLLHGVLPMAAVLHAASAEPGGATLFRRVPRVHDGLLDLTGLTLPTVLDEHTRELIERLLAVHPHAEPAATVRTRLLIAAATSLAGWLKYQRSLRGPEAWLATYGYLLWYLDLARTTWNLEMER